MDVDLLLDPVEIADTEGQRQVWAEPGAADAPHTGPAVVIPASAYVPGPYEPAAGAPPATAKKRKRVLWTVAAVVAAAGLVTGGVFALLPGRTGNSVVAAVKCDPTDLAGCLIKAPAGALRLTASDSKDKWPQQTVSTMDLFASNIVDDSSGLDADAKQELTSDGMHAVVHNDWNAVDGDDVDIVLLTFDTLKGAQVWNANREGEILASYPGQVVKIPGDTTGAAHVAAKPDAKKNIDAAYSVVVGNIVLDVAYSSPNTFDAQDLETWAGTELASLRTAPPAPGDPAPTAPGTQQVACTGRITSCLMPLPDGAQPWGAGGKSWSASTSLTPSQVVGNLWDGSTATARTAVLPDLTAAGVTGAAHESWTLAGGDEQADIYVIRAITATGAAQAASQNLGEPQWNGGATGIAFQIPGESSAQAWYTNKKDGGFTDVNFTEVIGNVDVVGWFFFYGSFNSYLADTWAKSQISRVRASVKTEPMGLLPLATPALPAPAQRGCGASAGCLIPLPAGAKDTTASSYDQAPTLNAQDYAEQYETLSGTEFGHWLASDGFQGGEHRSWTTSNGAATDAAVLKYTSPAKAEAAALLEYGINAGVNRLCTDSALPDSWCLATPVATTDPLQKEEIWVVAWKGDYEVSVSVTVSNSADVAQAYAWAEQQLDMLPAN